MKSEYSIAVFGLDSVRVDPHRDCECAVELASAALAAMHARPLGIRNGFPARNPDRVVFRLDFQCVLVDARKLDNGEKVISLLKHIDWREGAPTGRPVLEPVARLAGLQRPLKIEQRLERIGQGRDHNATSLCFRTGGDHDRSAAAPLSAIDLGRLLALSRGECQNFRAVDQAKTDAEESHSSRTRAAGAHKCRAFCNCSFGRGPFLHLNLADTDIRVDVSRAAVFLTRSLSIAKRRQPVPPQLPRLGIARIDCDRTTKLPIGRGYIALLKQCFAPFVENSRCVRLKPRRSSESGLAGSLVGLVVP